MDKKELKNFNNLLQNSSHFSITHLTEILEEITKISKESKVNIGSLLLSYTTLFCSHFICKQLYEILILHKSKIKLEKEFILKEKNVRY